MCILTRDRSTQVHSEAHEMNGIDPFYIDDEKKLQDPLAWAGIRHDNVGHVLIKRLELTKILLRQKQHEQFVQKIRPKQTPDKFDKKVID